MGRPLRSRYSVCPMKRIRRQVHARLLAHLSEGGQLEGLARPRACPWGTTSPGAPVGAPRRFRVSRSDGGPPARPPPVRPLSVSGAQPSSPVAPLLSRLPPRPAQSAAIGGDHRPRTPRGSPGRPALRRVGATRAWPGPRRSARCSLNEVSDAREPGPGQARTARPRRDRMAVRRARSAPRGAVARRTAHARPPSPATSAPSRRWRGPRVAWSTPISTPMTGASPAPASSPAPDDGAGTTRSRSRTRGPPRAAGYASASRSPRCSRLRDFPPSGPTARWGGGCAPSSGVRRVHEVLQVRTRRRPFALRVGGVDAAEVALDDTVIVVGNGQRPMQLRRVEVEVLPEWLERLEPLVEAAPLVVWPPAGTPLQVRGGAVGPRPRDPRLSRPRSDGGRQRQLHGRAGLRRAPPAARDPARQGTRDATGGRSRRVARHARGDPPPARCAGAVLGRAAGTGAGLPGGARLVGRPARHRARPRRAARRSGRRLR